MSLTRCHFLAMPGHLLHLLLVVSLLSNCGGSVQSAPDPRDVGGTGGTTAGTGGVTSSNGGDASHGGAISEPSACQLPAAPGNCDAYMPRYYFDAILGLCQPFVYGGCGGNDNRFESLEACITACDPGGLERCVYDDDCSVAQTGCCGTCEPTTLGDFTARSSRYASSQNCPGVACGACPTFDGVPNYPNFGARCVQGRCEVYDVRESNASSCTIDSDCRLRLGLVCCEGCSVANDWVAVNPAIASTGYFCSALVNCADCYRGAPANWSASCVLGHCLVKRGL